MSTGNGSNRSSQGPLGHVIRLGPLSQVLNIVLRAELRLDDVQWVRSRRTRTSSRYAAALQQRWPVPFGLRASLLHSLIGIRLPVSSELERTSCPGYGCARSSGIHASRHAAGNRSPRRVSQLDTWFMQERAMNTCDVVHGSRGSLIPDARASPSRAGTRSLITRSV